MSVFHGSEKLMPYCRFMMGAKTASRELTKGLLPIFSDTLEAQIIHDDVTVATKSKKGHIATLYIFL